MTQNKPIVVFVHIPKTAGTTFQVTISKNYDKSRILRLYQHPWNRTLDDIKQMPQETRDSYDFIAGHFAYGMHRYFKRPVNYVTFLRDPIEQALSIYYYILREPASPNHMRFKRDNVSLDQFILEIANDPSKQNIQTKYIAGIPRENDVGPADLELAKRYLTEKYCAFGIVERFDESLLLMASRMKWNNCYYRSFNISKSRPKKDELSEDLHLSLQRSYDLDMRLYHHACLLLSNRINMAGEKFPQQVKRFQKRNNIRGFVQGTMRFPLIWPVAWKISSLLIALMDRIDGVKMR